MTHEANIAIKKTFLFFIKPLTPVFPISALICAVTPERFSTAILKGLLSCKLVEEQCKYLSGRKYLTT